DPLFGAGEVAKEHLEGEELLRPLARPAISRSTEALEGDDVDHEEDDRRRRQQHPGALVAPGRRQDLHRAHRSRRPREAREPPPLRAPRTQPPPSPRPPGRGRGGYPRRSLPSTDRVALPAHRPRFYASGQSSSERSCIPRASARSRALLPAKPGAPVPLNE